MRNVTSGGGKEGGMEGSYPIGHTTPLTYKSNERLSCSFFISIDSLSNSEQAHFHSARVFVTRIDNQHGLDQQAFVDVRPFEVSERRGCRHSGICSQALDDVPTSFERA